MSVFSNDSPLDQHSPRQQPSSSRQSPLAAPPVQEPAAIKKAVALKYAPNTNAPVVVAKGKGKVAESILSLAKESGVPVQEDSSLVEVLSKLDIDQEIPAELYQLVAEVLSFVYRSDRKAREWREAGE